MALSPADPNRSRRQGRTKEEGRGKRRSRVTGAQARARPTASPATHHFSPLPTLRVTAARRSTGSDPLGRTSRVLTPPLLLLLPRRNDDIILALALALALASVAQDLPHQEEAGKEDALEPPHPLLDPHADRQHHQVQREAQALAPHQAWVLSRGGSSCCLRNLGSMGSSWWL